MIFTVYQQLQPKDDRIQLQAIGTVTAKDSPAAIKAAYDMPNFQSLKRAKMSDFPVVQPVHN